MVPDAWGGDVRHSVRIGSSFIGFKQKVLEEDARESVQSSAVGVLAGALEHGPGATGLVVGRVQSGKTLSYEGVIALARDNDFALVIVISGISNILLAQGEQRLKDDLGAADPTAWLFLSPSDPQQAAGHIAQELRSVRENWSDPSTPPDWKQTGVVFLLKHHARVRDLTSILDSVDFGDLRVLIIDDEADQASLNTLAKRSKESPTYGNLRTLRETLPNHYYLQYTATPQAPLLIAIDDALSPDFVRVLAPGPGYTGGDRYFTGDHGFVRTIADADVMAASNPGGPPPAGLRSAFLEFLVGATHVAATRKPDTRSMLVHPSRQKDDHHDFARWIRRMKEAWEDDYRYSGDVFPETLFKSFSAAWSDLNTTYLSIASLEQCWEALGLVFRNLEVIEVNTRAGQTPVINWSPTKSYVLVGGQAIDRGFTVKGLTVTYMPRPAGTFTADTIQQRARFFGYKENYLGLCRVYLDPHVRDVFEMYVEHERHMLASLREIEQGAETLKEWKRKFLLDSRMKATRASVITIPTIHLRTTDRWITDTTPVREDAIPFDVARETAEDILANATWARTASGHRVAHTSLRKALTLLELTSPESLLGEPNYQALALNLARRADEQESEGAVAIYWMQREDGGPWNRSLTASDTIQLFQGRNSSGYQGDRNEFDPTAQLTVQIHEVQVSSRETLRALGTYLLTAWRVPEKSSTGWLVELG